MREPAFRIQRKITESGDPMHDVPTEATQSRAGAPVAPWWHTALIALLLVGGSVSSTRAAHHDALAAHHAERYLFGICAEWGLLLLVWWGLHVKRTAFTGMLGFRRGWQALAEDVGVAAAFWIAAAIILVAIGLLLRALHLPAPQETMMAIAPRTPGELLLWIGLSLSAGFCEEFIFRGYFLRQFSSLGAGLWMGVACSSLLFGVSHGYEGEAGMIAITAYGALFCVLVFARNSLRPGMIAHAWNDSLNGVLASLVRN